MFLLNTEPSRLRSKSTPHDTLRYLWRHEDTPWVTAEEVTRTDKAFIYDEPKPRIAFKPCYAEKETHVDSPHVAGPDEEPGTVTDVGWLTCRSDPRSDRLTGKIFVNHHAGFGPLLLEDIVHSKQCQDAISNVLTQYYRYMYTIGNDLPDMTVFFKELSDFKRLGAQIISFSKGWSALARRLIKSDAKIRVKSKAAKKFISIIDAKDGITDEKKARSIADAFVGYNFGVAAPLRDICGILTEILAKLDALVPDGQIRREHFTAYYTDVSRSPDIQTYPSSTHRCGRYPIMWGQPTHDQSVQTVRELKVRVSITSDLSRVLSGSPIEKAIAAILGLLGLLPNVETIWEMTKLSWALDYFIRADKLFRKLGIYSMSPVKPIVLSECCSISVEQTLTTEGLACQWRSKPTLVSKYEYFERALGTYPLESVLDYATYPGLKEAALVAAVAKQWF